MTTATLDITPMLVALREHPAQFTPIEDIGVRHKRSRHEFRLSCDMVIITTERRVQCECSGKRLRQVACGVSTGAAFRDALADWRMVYWEPHQREVVAREEALLARQAAAVNRRFARHFKPIAGLPDAMVSRVWAPGAPRRLTASAFATAACVLAVLMAIQF